MKRAEHLFKKKIIAEYCQNLGKDLDIKIYKANRTLYFLNVKRASPIQVIMKLSKINVKERIFKASREK